MRLLNDLEAAGYGVLLLGPDELAELQPGRPREGHRALIAAGTGLGQAFLIWQQGHHHVVASEGGHGDFAPRDEREGRLLAHLRRLHGRASYEHVLSGRGWWRSTGSCARTTGRAAGAGVAHRELAEETRRRRLRGGAGRSDPAARRRSTCSCRSTARRPATSRSRAVAVGGVIVGGGIAPKILSALSDGAFVRAFRDKGRMAKLMAEIPVRVALNPETALLGAASVAKRLLSEG